MQAGELLQVGTPLEIYHKPNCADVAEFFGSVNWLDGEVVAPGVAQSQIGKLRIEATSRPGEKVLLGFRPECLHFANGAEQPNSFGGRIATSTFLGDQFIFSVIVNDQLLVGKNRNIPQAPDGTVELRVQPSDIMVFAPRPARKMS